MMRRALLLAAITTAASAEAQNSADADLAWNQNFRAFIKALNHFIESSNDGFFDAKQWKRVRAAWHDLDGKESCQK
jgi:hypothetical protein